MHYPARRALRPGCNGIGPRQGPRPALPHALMHAAPDPVSSCRGTGCVRGPQGCPRGGVKNFDVVQVPVMLCFFLLLSSFVTSFFLLKVFCVFLSNLFFICIVFVLIFFFHRNYAGQTAQGSLRSAEHAALGLSMAPLGTPAIFKESFLFSEVLDLQKRCERRPERSCTPACPSRFALSKQDFRVTELRFSSRAVTHLTIISLEKLLEAFCSFGPFLSTVCHLPDPGLGVG